MPPNLAQRRQLDLTAACSTHLNLTEEKMLKTKSGVIEPETIAQSWRSWAITWKDSKIVPKCPQIRVLLPQRQRT